MITNIVEEGDVITLGSEDTFTVAEVGGEGEAVSITLKDDDGMAETFYFTAGDPLNIVVSWDDPEVDTDTDVL
jgi:hypothetical protein